MSGGVPGAILGAAIDVRPVLQQMLDDGAPAAGAGFVERAVARVVAVIHLTHAVLQTVQHHLLEGERGREKEREREGGGRRSGESTHAFLQAPKRTTTRHLKTAGHIHKWVSPSQFMRETIADRGCAGRGQNMDTHTHTHTHTHTASGIKT